MRTRPHHQRGGFTLVEVVVTITIIAILAAILVPTLGSAYRRSQEFAIESEMNLMGSAIEQFKTEYGFYPPSFRNITSADDLLPFINRIAPNHAETTIVSGTTRRIDVWWTNVGSNIAFDEGDDLVFWLSGLAKNQQFPLTATNLLPSSMMSAYNPSEWFAYPAEAADSTNYAPVERKVFFEFKADRLEVDTRVAQYHQARGPAEPYLYLDASAYGDIASGMPAPKAYYRGTEFFNPTTFQLAAEGLDGAPGFEGNVDAGGATASQGLDNIVNFSSGGAGRLETIMLNAN